MTCSLGRLGSLSGNQTNPAQILSPIFEPGSLSAPVGSLRTLQPELGIPLVGINTLKHVVHFSLNRRLRQVMRPSYFCAMPLLIQSPKPVPFVDLVVKKG